MSETYFTNLLDEKKICGVAEVILLIKNTCIFKAFLRNLDLLSRLKLNKKERLNER